MPAVYFLLAEPSKFEDSRESRCQIQMIIKGNNEDEWSVYDHNGQLNSGYLRPLFLYAEYIDREENEWAVEKISQMV